MHVLYPHTFARSNPHHSITFLLYHRYLLIITLSSMRYLFLNNMVGIRFDFKGGFYRTVYNTTITYVVGEGGGEESEGVGGGSRTAGCSSVKAVVVFEKVNLPRDIKSHRVEDARVCVENGGE